MTPRLLCWYPKQENGGHIGVPNLYCGSSALFLCNRFVLFQYICIAACHVSKSALFITHCRSSGRRFQSEIIIIMVIIIIIITYLTRVNPSAEAVINGCPGQLRNKQFKEKITMTAKLSEKCKNYVQCR